MLARLILALLLAAFAVPAAAPAACHDTAKVAHASHAMPMPATGHSDQKATPPHGCIGCVPPSNWTAVRVAEVMPAATPPLVARARVLTLGAAPTPDTPPPRAL